ncbi:MAG: FGGY family carbohydrate kinase, partial [Propionivibrio sp.]
IDVGTGSVRAALVDTTGKILKLVGREHAQMVPQYGWSEQRPADWWRGATEVTRQVLEQVPQAKGRIAAVCACGQMHATVLIDAAGQLTRETAPLWNDKRTAPQVAAFRKEHPGFAYLADTANPPTPAWPAFKLQWIKANDPDAYARAATVFMPKDYVNFRLCGERAMDWTDASISFLMDPKTRDWSAALVDQLGLARDKLPPVRSPLEILGQVSAQAANETGLREGTPVLVGGGDYPVSMIGSGVVANGLGSDITGTSSIITVMADSPMLHPEVSNVATLDGLWGRFMLLDSGGDAVRWARRAFHQDQLSYAEVTQHAGDAPVGSDGLFFLPYLSGERFGEHPNSRAQFFGLTAQHQLAHLHRAVLEGVAFGVRKNIDTIVSTGVRLERIVAASGGAKADLWLQIKADMYQTPIVVPSEPEGGVVGCAMLAATALGHFPTLQAASNRFVHFEREFLPAPRASEIYDRMAPIFERLYVQSQALYDDLDRLAMADA